MKQCRECHSFVDDKEEVCPVCLHIFDELDIDNCNIYSENEDDNGNIFITIISILILSIITFFIIILLILNSCYHTY